MTTLDTLLALPDSYSLFTVIGVSFFALAFGIAFKYGLLAKSKRRVLKLEDEMLSNHARILSLEKKIAELELENKSLKSNTDTSLKEKKISDFGLKVS